MIVILKQFEEELTVYELINIIESQLKASNLNSKGVSIYFKTYPQDYTQKLYDIPPEVLESGLNTIVFDTIKNIVTVYVKFTSAFDYVAYKKDEEGKSYLPLESNYVEVSNENIESPLKGKAIETEEENLLIGNNSMNLVIQSKSVPIYRKLVLDEEECPPKESYKDEYFILSSQFEDLVKRVEALEENQKPKTTLTISPESIEDLKVGGGTKTATATTNAETITTEDKNPEKVTSSVSGKIITFTPVDATEPDSPAIVNVKAQVEGGDELIVPYKITVLVGD